MTDEDTRRIPLSEDEQVREALIWMTGSDDFAPGGKARKGFEQIVRPVLDRLFPES